MYCQELTCAKQIKQGETLCSKHEMVPQTAYDTENLEPDCKDICAACGYGHYGNSRNMSGVIDLCVTCDIYLCHMLLENKDILHQQPTGYYYDWIRASLFPAKSHASNSQAQATIESDESQGESEDESQDVQETEVENVIDLTKSLCIGIDFGGVLSIHDRANETNINQLQLICHLGWNHYRC
jgi:hypothetical protein